MHKIIIILKNHSVCVYACMHGRSHGVFEGQVLTGTEFKIVCEGTNKHAGNETNTAKSFNASIYLHV